MKRLLAVVVGMGVLAAAAWWLPSAIRGSRRAPAAPVPTAEVARGRLTVTLPANGFLESAGETRVSTDVDGTIIELYENNSPVEAGQVVFRLDTKRLVDERDGLLRDLADAREALNQTQADGDVQITGAESEVRRAREALALAQAEAQADRDQLAAQVNFAQGEAERAQRELERAQRLARLNYIPGVKLREAEKAYRSQQFALEQKRLEQAATEHRTAEQVADAQAALAMAEQQLQATRVNVRLAMDDARLNLDDLERKLADVNGRIERCQVTAPTSGLAVAATNTENWPERRPYRVGDLLRANREAITIYDLSDLRVRCQIGEMDIARVSKGQQAWVLSPADSNRRYPAQVAALDEMAREASVWEGGTPGKKVFRILLTLAEADPAHLRPGMTVDLEIILDDIAEAVTVPVQAIFTQGERALAYRRQGDAFEAVAVTVGRRSDLLAEIEHGLRPGDRVALARPPAGQVVSQ